MLRSKGTLFVKRPYPVILISIQNSISIPISIPILIPISIPIPNPIPTPVPYLRSLGYPFLKRVDLMYCI